MRFSRTTPHGLVGRALGLVAGLITLTLLGGCASPVHSVRGESPDQDLPGSPVYGLGAFLGNVAYVPLKLIYAGGGTLVGGIAWAATGGNAEVRDAIMDPALSGDYVLTPRHLRGLEPLEFVGRTGRRRGPEVVYDSELPHVGAGIPAPPGSCEALPGYARIHFAHDASALRDQDEQVLRVVAETLETCPRQRVLVEGHADAMGEGPYNFGLSLRRAQAVQDYLVAQGIDATRIEPTGLGESQPVSRNDTPGGRAANRRVEFSLP